MEEEFQDPAVISMIPDALFNKEKTMLSLRHSRSAEIKKPSISLFEKEDEKYEQLYQKLLDYKRQLQEDVKRLNVESEKIKKDVLEMDLEQNIIRNNIITLKQTLSNTKKHLPDEEELSNLVEKVCSLRDGIGKRKSDLKNELEKFKKGILFYHNYLHCKAMLVSKDSLVITFDTSAKSVSEVREFLKFSFHDQDATFQYLEMQPKLKVEQQLVKIYKETGDIQGFIVSFWNLTKRSTSRKVLCEKNSG